MDNNDLQHHGIKGMRWGVRRTPAQLGHKPAAKKKKSGFSLFKKKEGAKAKPEVDAKAKAKAEAAAKAKAEVKARKKSPKEMTNDELQSAVRNLQLQKQYKDLEAELNPQKKGFIKSFVDDSVKPAALSAGKTVLTDYLTKMGKKYLGIDAEEAGDALGALKKEVEKLELYAKGSKAKYHKSYFDKERENLEKTEDSNGSKGPKNPKDAKNPKNPKGSEDSEQNTGKTSKFKKSEESKTYRKKVYTGEVVGEGSSKSKMFDKDWPPKSSNSNKDDVVTSFYDPDSGPVTVYRSSGKSYTSNYSNNSLSGISQTSISSGREYVSGLLEEPK